MNERETTKEVVDKNDDWAILPFDKAEDDKRWEKLTRETEQLERNVAQFEATHGEKILMNEPLVEVQAKNISEDLEELF